MPIAHPPTAPASGGPAAPPPAGTLAGAALPLPLPLPASDPYRPCPDHSHPWRRGSVFGDGPRRPLCSEQRRAWISRAELERRAGRLTTLHVEVGRALLRRLGVDGRCDPAHATLATDAGAGPRTVGRALALLRELGLLSWERRLVRRPWPAGGAGAQRAEQTSNAYELLLPQEAPAGLVLPLPPVRLVPRARVLLPSLPHCDGQDGRESPSRDVPTVQPPPDPAARDALQAVAAARLARIGQEWATKQAERWRGRTEPPPG